MGVREKSPSTCGVCVGRGKVHARCKRVLDRCTCVKKTDNTIRCPECKGKGYKPYHIREIK